MMEESNRRLYLQFSLLILIGCFTSQLCASSDPIFYDSFDDLFEGSWIVSEKEDDKVTVTAGLSTKGLIGKGMRGGGGGSSGGGRAVEEKQRWLKKRLKVGLGLLTDIQPRLQPEKRTTCWY
ncbi:hypothetical protein LOK49_LG01G03463 [Camellia lanceoleosa]|uniref:Uncharacterized protein n=1 Tax=Camellia lanceoleosa TaxID=1840588 RepID=A0ACC0J0H9_9ERIC|nr:hypothetical protein LOK49_LG01G03463 [Camellia lanceoleosa]